ncbi:alpha/beta hydrolase family protein [Alicyclobacillus dauci]|uniref:DUF2974 domain-containing protein n=1 Tax=Alicyclobacillus dauci TaxID=1475485 RepID=A0ABY6YXC2_9BACL|nr:Mbeg1-like protein [Alicyclobacillus dauci]WAH35161.1 DUF2974 domain-containing protein [Alicyclobacillus dauci]
MRTSAYWRRLLGFTVASALFVIPFRFLIVNAVVDPSAVENAKPNQEVTSTNSTGGVYDGVLMKMSDLSYADLNPYRHQTLGDLESLSAKYKGPSGVYKQVEYVDNHDWHIPYPAANQLFFSDMKDWRIIATDDEETEVGFYAVAYQKGNTIVIAYRGTNDVADLLSDAGIYLQVSEWIDQLAPAQHFVDQVRSSLPQGQYQVVFTGHSMGAWLAQRMYVTYLNKYPAWHVAGATVFDSIGTHFHPDVSGVTHVKDYRYQGDVFSHYGSSLGQEIEVKDPTPGQSLYDKHQMHDFYPYFYPVHSAQLRQSTTVVV